MRIMPRPSPSRSRRSSALRALAPAGLVLCALLAAAGGVQAALPAKGAEFTFADHVTAHKNWHLEFTIDASNPKKIASLIVYSQLCKRTVVKRGVPITDAGGVAAGGGLAGGGTWEVNAAFVKSTKIVGTMRMTRAGCDTGVLSYPNKITGDGRGSHAGHHHGPKYPNFAAASLTQRRQALGLHRSVLRTWRGTTLAQAQRLGFFRLPQFANQKKLGVFHVYNQSYETDGRIFDAAHPESLVFWRRAKGQPVILGLMFRVPLGKRPSFAGPIPIYHTHAPAGKKPTSQMTHVWMVADGKIAWANCMPIEQLEQYDAAFKWMPGRLGIQHVGVC